MASPMPLDAPVTSARVQRVTLSPRCVVSRCVVSRCVELPRPVQHAATLAAKRFVGRALRHGASGDVGQSDRKNAKISNMADGAPFPTDFDTSDVDPDEASMFAFQVYTYKMGEMVSLMIHLGDRLGLYRFLAGKEPLTAEQVADQTGYHPRWILEWLRGQEAAKLLTYDADGETFQLSKVGASVLADENHSLFFAAGAFAAPQEPAIVERLAEAFTTGLGLSWEELGPNGAHRTERMLGPWSRLAFVPNIIPALEGVKAKLETGAMVADVGCGAGLALRVLAAEFPNSTFHGYDPSETALDIARKKAATDGLENISFIHAGGEDLPADQGYDFIYTFDCLHDMTRPADVIAAIKTALKPDGTWLIKDIRSSGDFVKNHKNPMLAMHYGFSVSSCMSSAMSEPGGAGLGTLGFSPPVAEEMCRAAGFGHFEQHDFGDPANLYYEVRA